MRRLIQMFSIACAAMLVAGCEQPDAPLRSAEGSRPGQDLTGLTVSISGDEWVSSTQTSYFTASVSGGNGTYYYTWYMQSCNEYPVDEEWCESDPYPSWIHSQGTGVNTASRWRAMYDLRIKVTVYVTEVGGTKGGSAVFWQYGPNSLD